MKLFLITLAAVLFMCACTPEPKHLPSESKYNEDTSLMMNVGNKFAEESDAKKLHGAAISTQTVRLITCSDFNDECSLYGKFVSLVVKVSADNFVSASEREELRTKLAELRAAIETGKKLLREAWAKKNKI